MPKIKRWFPVSHDINRDPELWALREHFGEKILACWLELLSIADRNEGVIPGELNAISSTVAWVIRCKTSTTLRYINAITTLGWLTNNGQIRVSKFAEYHRTRGTKRAPSKPSEPSEPTKPTIRPPISPKRGTRVEAEDFVFNRFWNTYPRKVKKAEAYRAWCKEAKLCTDVQTAIFAALEWQVRQEDWLKDDGRFVPYPASYLNGRRWEDEPPKLNGVSARTQAILTRGL